jgi:hypothetical protein
MKLKLLTLRSRYLQIILSPFYLLSVIVATDNITTCTTSLDECFMHNEIAIWQWQFHCRQYRTATQYAQIFNDL